MTSTGYRLLTTGGEVVMGQHFDASLQDIARTLRRG